MQVLTSVLVFWYGDIGKVSSHWFTWPVTPLVYESHYFPDFERISQCLMRFSFSWLLLQWTPWLGQSWTPSQLDPRKLSVGFSGCVLSRHRQGLVIVALSVSDSTGPGHLTLESFSLAFATDHWYDGCMTLSHFASGNNSTRLVSCEG